MILQDGAKTLTEAVTKSNRLKKCRTINRGGHFQLRRRSKLPALKNRFTEVVKTMVVLRQLPPKMVYFLRRSSSVNRFLEMDNYKACLC
jgi:midasin (ATPase involved in ribosome maturation)